jgi:Tfp pilus assembly protein PilO
MDDEYQWQAVAAIIGVFILVTSVIVVLIWKRTTTTRAKALLSRESDYRDLSEEGAKTQQTLLRQLETVNSRLADMQNRLDGVERILKETE